MIVYKYLDYEGVIGTIDNSSALLRTPDRFNDPFDCDFYVSKKEKKKAFDLLMNYHCFKELYSFFIIEQKEPVRFKCLGKITKKNVSILAESLSKEKRYKYQPDLGVLYAFYKVAMKKDDIDLKKEFDIKTKEALDKVRKALLVSCFTQKYDSILMWSIYAKDHTGGCVELEMNDKDLRKVKYLRKRKTFKLSKAFEYLLACDFNEEKMEIDEKIHAFAAEPIFYKSKAWENEKELRCVFSNNNRDKRIEENENGVFLTGLSVKRIILGCQASKKLIEDVERTHKNIPIYQMKIVDGQYKLVAASFKQNNISESGDQD